MDPAVPTTPTERIVTLDILRGFALLGILVVNMASFAGTWREQPTTPWDSAALFVVEVLFAGKFNSLFSLLFAIGFTIQLERLEQRGRSDARLIYVRRLLVLFAIGIAHAVLIWDGDVLHMYALLGFVLLLMRNVSDRTCSCSSRRCCSCPACAVSRCCCLRRRSFPRIGPRCSASSSKQPWLPSARAAISMRSR